MSVHPTNALTLAALLASTGALRAQSLTLESANAQGIPVGGYSGGTSDDGRYVLVLSNSNQMLPGDSSFHNDAFVRDRSDGSVELVSPSATGGFANQDVGAAVLSADGRFVAFQGYASDHVDNDDNAASDIFLADRTVLPALELVSVSSAGQQGNGPSSQPSISADGRYVAFTSVASNLVAGDSAGWQDVFLRDRATGTTTRISQTSLGLDADLYSARPALSADGRFVSFESGASNLVVPDANGQGQDILLFDIAASALERVSVGASGAQGSFYSNFSSLSADGRFVIYTTAAPELTGVPYNGNAQVVLHDRQLVVNELISVTNGGLPANGACTAGQVSLEGNRVSFSSQANNLGGSGSFSSDAYLRDRVSQETTLASVDVDGQPLAVDSASLWLSTDGQRLLLWSQGALVPPDINAMPDLFLLELQAPAPQIEMYCTAKTSSTGCVPVIGANGVPHESGNDAFFLFARLIMSQKSGLFFWGRQSASLPFGGGTLCVQPPTTRTPVQNSQGGTGCTGLYSLHFTQAYMVQENVQAGDTLYGQFWYRDPGFAPPNNIGLSNAASFVVEP